jgi:hypothetical protein
MCVIARKATVVGCKCYVCKGAAVKKQSIEWVEAELTAAYNSRDNNICSDCHFDHALQPTQSYNAHADILVSNISTKLLSFASSIHASKLSSKVVHKCMRDVVRASMTLIDPEFLYDKIRIAIENEGVEIKW